MSDDALRLTNCPACDYSLATLPPEGVCPECGRKYDQSWIIFSGRGRGRFDSVAGGTWRGMIWVVALIPVALWVFADMSSAFRHPMLLAFSVMIVATILIEGYVLIFSSGRPRTQLWLCAAGAFQGVASYEGRQAAYAHAFIRLLYYPVFLTVWLISGISFTSPGFILIACMALWTAGWWIWRMMDRKRELARTPEAMPWLTPWDRVEKADVKSLDDERVRIRLETSTYFGPIKLTQEPVADIEVPMNPQVAQKVRDQISRWKVPQ